MQWQELKTAGQRPTASTRFPNQFLHFARQILAQPNMISRWRLLSAAEQSQFLHHLRQLVAGNVVCVGRLPQLDLVFLAVLFFTARQQRVFVFSSISLGPDLYKEWLVLLTEMFGIKVMLAGPAPEKSAHEKREAFRTDLIICDYPEFMKTVRAEPETLADQPSAAIFLEADLWLYDSRLFFFDRQNLRAVGAIYRSGNGSVAVAAEDAIMDVRQTLASFTAMCGTTSILPAAVGREMANTYRPLLQGVLGTCRSALLPSLVYQTTAEKMQALGRDMASFSGDTLVFCCQEETRRGVAQELTRRGIAFSLAGSTSELLQLFAAPAAAKRVVLYLGLPGLISQLPRWETLTQILLAEHYQFAHHHAKIRALADAVMARPFKPWLYFSLEDALFRESANNLDFARSFHLIEQTEGWFARRLADLAKHWHLSRLVRIRSARAILKQYYRLWESSLTTETPIITNDLTIGRDSRNRPKAMSRLAKSLGGLCYCGSGKTFRECHGKGAPATGRKALPGGPGHPA